MVFLQLLGFGLHDRFAGVWDFCMIFFAGIWNFCMISCCLYLEFLQVFCFVLLDLFVGIWNLFLVSFTGVWIFCMISCCRCLEWARPPATFPSCGEPGLTFAPSGNLR